MGPGAGGHRSRSAAKEPEFARFHGLHRGWARKGISRGPAACLLTSAMIGVKGGIRPAAAGGD
jgi:hypothetical protein